MRHQLDLFWSMPGCTLYGEVITPDSTYKETFLIHALAKTVYLYIETKLALHIH